MKKILIVTLVAIVLYAIVTYSLNVFLPAKIRTQAQQFVKETIHKNMDISKVRISIVNGIALDTVTIYENDKTRPILAMRQLQVKPFYPSLLIQKKIILSIDAYGVRVPIQREANGQWNFSHIIEAFAQKRNQTQTHTLPLKKVKAENKQEPFFLIKDVEIKDLQVDFEDKTCRFKKEFAHMNLRAAWEDKTLISFALNWESNLTAQGVYDFNKGINAHIALKDIALGDFNPYYKSYTVQQGSLKKALLTLKGKDTYILQGATTITDIIVLRNNIEYKGALDITGRVSFAKERVSYQLKGNLTKGAIHGLSSIDSLFDIYSRFSLDNKKLELSFAQASLPFSKKLAPESTKEALQLKGRGELNLETSAFYLETETSAALVDAIAAAGKVTPLNFAYGEKGTIQLKAVSKGNIAQKTLQYYVEYDIKGARIKEAKDIDVKGFMKNDLLVVEDGAFRYKTIPFKLKGQLERFSAPLITLNLTSDILKADVSAEYTNKNIDIQILRVKSAGSHITSQGTINLAPSLQVTLQGTGVLEGKDMLTLANAFGIPATALKKAQPEGTVEIKFIINGTDKPQECEIKLAGSSDSIKIYGVEAKQATIELHRDKNELVISPFTAMVAQGKIQWRFKADSLNNKLITNLLINDINLGYLRAQLNLKQKNLSGTLSLEADIENESLTQWDKLKGQGKVSIKDGDIWEIDFLKGLGEFIFIPEFGQIKFESGYSDLFFKGQDVVFENLELKSYQMVLKGTGRISLKGDLNFILITEFNQNLIAASSGLQKIISGILGQGSLAIELGGTVQKPSYKVKPTFFSNVDGVKNILDKIWR